MCKIGGGANRCDAHWGPAQKAADLAKRRAKYAAKKGGKVRAYKKQDALTVLEEVKSVTHQKAGDFKVVGVNKNNPVLKAKDVSDTALIEIGLHTHDETLGIHTSKLTGELVRSDYYADRTIEGVINWENLDEESYTAFGFQPIDEEHGKGLTVQSSKMLYDNSAKELSSMNQENINALKIFTSNSYRWINGSLYNTNPDAKNSLETQPDEDVELTDGEQVEHEEKTITKLTEIVKQLDEAIEKAPGQQRIVYRGLKKRTLCSGNETIEDVIGRMKLGQEMVFDGYQSASYGPQVANDYGLVGENYGESQGVLFEIRTSSGVNVISESHYDHEKEVLLPRNARYMVVGIHKKVDYKTNENNQNTTKGAYVVQLVEITENGEIVSAETRPASPPPLTALQSTTATLKEWQW